ncbi:hypothetical protein ACIPY2_05805 [Paenarthrobacter sp. NPDC089675]|uniref:hypothetical protein n=1 Tax=Paenarthrobacter sp. NPDC089675 TaxID=3364376 RepID=UPI0037F56CD2
MSLLAAEFVLVVPVDLAQKPKWTKGPLKLVNLPGTPHEIVSDTSGRARYVPGSHVPFLLYGDTKDERRWHQSNEETFNFRSERGHDVDFVFTGRELFWIHDRTPHNALLVVHGRVNGTAEQCLRTLVELSNLDPKHGASIRSALESQLGTASLGSGVRRARLMSLVCPDDAGLPTIASNLEPEWSAKDQWLWYLATAHMPGTITVSRDSHDQVRSRSIRVTDEWSGFVASEGVSYVADRLPPAGLAQADALRQRKLRFHTIELDAFLLAEAQDVLINRIGDALFQARKGGHHSSQSVAGMSSPLAAYRLMNWGDRITERGYTNDLFLSLRSVKGIPDRLTELREDVREAITELEAQSAASRNAALGVLAILGFPFSSAFAIWAGIEDRTIEGLWTAIASAAGASLMLSLVIPGLRSIAAQAIGLKNRIR